MQKTWLVSFLHKYLKLHENWQYPVDKALLDRMVQLVDICKVVIPRNSPQLARV